MAFAAYLDAVQKIYIAFYQRPADPAGLRYWAQRMDAAGGDQAAVIDAFASSDEAKALYGEINNDTIGTVIDAIYQALYNRAPDAGGKQFYVDAFKAGTYTAGTIALNILNGASNDDAVAIANKLGVANEFTKQVDGRALTDPEFGSGTNFNATYAGDADAVAARAILAGVTSNPASVLDASKVTVEIKDKIADTTDPINGQTGGKTLILTEGVDSFGPTQTGAAQTTNGDDVIIGSVGPAGPTNTLSSLDSIDGGAGIDTLKITSAVAGAIPLPSLSNVEIVEVQTTVTGATIDTTAATGVTDLKVTKVVGAFDATAGDATNINVAVKDSGALTVDGGKDVTVKVTDSVAASTVTVGATTAAKGAVVVEAAAKAAVNGSDVTMGDITVKGGKTISITQKVGDASGLVAGGTATKHTQGDVTVAANAETTTVTVKQDVAATEDSATAVAKVDEVATVTFTALTSGASVTVGGLTFTAGRDLTAAQVAQAFANLSATAPKPGAANGDTNGGDTRADGTFSGSLLAKWSSGAASGSTVTFTGSGSMTNLSATGATAVTTTEGVDAVPGKNVLGVVAGKVEVTGAAALKTVTIDSYGAASEIKGGTNAALDTISLANGAGFTIASAAATLGLTLKNVNGTVDVQAGTKTLEVGVSHAKASETTGLKSATVETVKVSGDGNVAGTAANLSVAKSIDTSAMTGGTANFTINGTTTTYTGGAGKDIVEVTNAGTAITKAINLGAGDDTLILTGTVAVPTATLDGGAGTNTISLNSASAAALSANGSFAAKIDNFQKLQISDKTNAATTVDLSNLDNISYVISANSNASAGSPGNTQKYAFDIAGLVLDSTGTLRVNGEILYTAGADGVDAATIANGATTNATVTIGGVTYNITNVGTVITLTSTSPVAPQPAVTVTGADNVDTPITNAGVTTTPGAATVAAGTYLTLDKMADNGTLELLDAGAGVVVKMADASGSADSFNIVTKVNAADLDFGTVDVAGVEALKLNAIDTSTTAAINTATVAVKADKATSLTIEGNSNVTLTLDATTMKLATIDANTLTGKLVAGATGKVAMTITGGSGADTLKASVGANAKSDVINGGAGNDWIYAGSNGATLTGGDGNDLFILTANSATEGNKESNTYSTITDFQAGDLLKLEYWNGAAATKVGSFLKLAANLNDGTAVFSDFVNAAIKEAGAGEAVYFNFKGDAYVVIDSHNNSAGDVFINGEDLVIKLAGVNGDNLSWNSDFGTVALV